MSGWWYYHGLWVLHCQFFSEMGCHPEEQRQQVETGKKAVHLHYGWKCNNRNPQHWCIWLWWSRHHHGFLCPWGGQLWKGVLWVLSDDTDVFVTLVHWIYWVDIQYKVQMDHWDGTALNINSTCATYSQMSATPCHACPQWMRLHLISLCQRQDQCIKYFVEKGLPRHSWCARWGGCHRGSICQRLQKLILHALYGQQPGTSVESACFMLVTKKKIPKLMTFPPTTPSQLQHVLRTHLKI